MTLILPMNTQFGQVSAGTAHLCSTWYQLGWLEAGSWIIWRLTHSYVWCQCWLQAETSIGLSIRMQIYGLSKWLLASSQHGGWVPRASAPRESHVEAITPFTTQPWKSRSVTSTMHGLQCSGHLVVQDDCCSCIRIWKDQEEAAVFPELSRDTPDRISLARTYPRGHSSLLSWEIESIWGGCVPSWYS